MEWSRIVNRIGRIEVSVTAPQRRSQTSEDSDIREVEHRPAEKMHEVDHTAAAQNVQQISGSTAESQTETDQRSAGLEPVTVAMQEDC